MNYRTFGNTGWKVSEIGLGTWQIGGDWGDVDDSTAEKVLATAVENGVTFFDTADCYGEGLSESRLGRFVKTLSKEVVIAFQKVSGWTMHLGQIQGFYSQSFQGIFRVLAKLFQGKIIRPAGPWKPAHLGRDHHLFR